MVEILFARLDEIVASSETLTFADAGFDVLWGWDESADQYKNFTLADILTEASPAAGDFLLLYGAEGDLRKVNWSSLPAGGGTPGGSDTHVQFNDSSAFGGDADFTWNKTSNALTVLGTIELGHASDTTLSRSAAGVLQVEGVTVLTEGNAEAFLESAIDTLVNLTSVQGFTVTLADAGFDVLVGWDDSVPAYKNMLLADIATEGTPAAGDFVLIYAAEGDLRKANWNTLPGGGGGISNVSEDTDPELGGTLNSNNFDIILEQYSADAVSADLFFDKSRNAVVGSHTVVQSGDDLGRIIWRGSDGTNMEQAAYIMAEVDGTPGNNDMPGRLVFATTADAGVTPTERLILDSAGVLKPVANDGVALGTGALSYADLFLASGAVINFNNGNVTVTHAAGALTVAGATSVSIGTGNAFTTGTIELGAASDTTLSRASAGVLAVEGVSVPMPGTANTWTALNTFTLGTGATNEPVRILNTNDNASVQVMQLEGDRATMADNDEAYVSLLLSNDGGTQTEFARLTWVATDVNAGTSVDGRIDFAVVTAGSLADELFLDGTTLGPSTNDGLALGTTALGFADLHLATGGVINWANGEVTITETDANTLTVAGATAVSLGTAAAFTTGTIELGAASDTTLSRSSAGVLAVEGSVVPTVGVANTWTALNTFTLGTGATNEPVRILNTTDNASVQVMQLEGDRATMAANDEAYVSMLLSDSAGNQDEFARVTWRGVDVTSGSNDARLSWSVAIADALTAKMQLEGSVFAPAASDGTALGSGTLMWADLFLASGGVINFNNGNYTITHSAGLLTTNGNLSLTTSGVLTTGTIELGAASDTTISRTGAGAIAVEGATIWTSANDGAGSTLDADLLDGKNTGTSGNVVPLLDGTNTWSGQQTITLGAAATTEPLRLVNTTDNASVQVIQLEGDRATMAANDEAYVSMLLSDSAGNQDEFARLTWRGVDVTSGSNDARFTVSVTIADSLTDKLRLEGSVLSPAASDGTALGSGSLMWADLFLADGAVVNFNNGNYTITHSAGLLTTNGNLSLTTSGVLTTGTIELGAASDTTLTRSGAGDVSIEGNVIYRAGGTDVALADGGTGTSLADPNADRLMFWDDSAAVVKFGALADITNEGAPASGDFVLIYGAEGDFRRTDWANLPGAGGGLSNAYVTITDGTTPANASGGDTFKLRATAPLTVVTENDNGTHGDNALFSTSLATDRLLGRDTAGTGVAEEISLSTGLEFTGSASIRLTAAYQAVGTQMIPIPAITCDPRSTNGATKFSAETTTNDIMIVGYEFNAATEQAIQCAIVLPKQVDESATLTFRFHWTARSGSGDVIWGVRALARSEGDPIDTALGTAVTVTDTLTTADDEHLSSTSSAMTVGGTWAENDVVWLEFYRDADAGGDTLSATAILLHVDAFFTTVAANDA